jgi:alkylated DNA repair protein (DNA oxidative demethylase)
MTRSWLADTPVPDEPAGRQQLGENAWLLRGFALSEMRVILSELAEITARAPFRHMVTPGGRTMSVALTNCGLLGWTSDRHGYRYAAHDPVSRESWPPMPASFMRLASGSAAEAGFGGFTPDACLINRYVPEARLSLHQDRDERDFASPIVSVSLGMSAVFLFGGLTRAQRPARVLLEHGDVVVWGGVDRLRFHGVLPLKEEPENLFAVSRHPMLLGQRINLTFRKAG